MFFLRRCILNKPGYLRNYSNANTRNWYNNTAYKYLAFFGGSLVTFSAIKLINGHSSNVSALQLKKVSTYATRRKI